MIYWLLKHIVAGPILRSLFGPDIVGAEHLPKKKGAVIFASNHLSVIDSFLLPLVLRRRIYFLAKSEYFTGKGIKGTFVRWFFKSTGMLSIDRSGGKASEASLRTGLEVLNRGEWLGIYPEGTRSPDARLYRGRTGIARMILECERPVQVVPVVMVDAEKIMPIGAKRPKPGKVTIRFGEPLDFSRYHGMSGNRFVLRAITDEVMSEIAILSEQEYVDGYASSYKRAAAA
ncbi:lysophospholipid acyltransferase family protein [Gulosibacter faecalis]|jgi:1-acyl-sn-glycerol-3-phosphate acyltransferase|uniref:Lysophospholipid acyltransferase family protein n=1 Tax=Gulosibacter faecalis TaxID=272240 RepID=A0ABW5V065_9MICO|nr:lysophospholipid acyltransferase family protein [Gulosibacter faecalis]